MRVGKVPQHTAGLGHAKNGIRHLGRIQQPVFIDIGKGNPGLILLLKVLCALAIKAVLCSNLPNIIEGLIVLGRRQGIFIALFGFHPVLRVPNLASNVGTPAVQNGRGRFCWPFKK